MDPSPELFIPTEKVAQYLLNISHPSGQPKAEFFIRNGFRPENPEELVEALKAHFFHSDDKIESEWEFGPRIIVTGDMMFPNGRTFSVRVVWMKEHGTDVIKLVTAHRI